MIEVQKALDQVASQNATKSRDGLIHLLQAIQRQDLESEDLLAAPERVVSSMDMHLTDTAVQRWGAEALDVLFRRFAIQGPANERAICALIGGAKSNCKGAEVQRWCFGALTSSLALATSDRLAILILEQDVMGVVANAMQSHPESPALLESAAGLICLLVSEAGEAAADQAYDTGCLRLLQGILQSSEDTCLKASCLRALWAVSESNGELGATELAADSGLESAITILMQEPELHRWAASLVQSMLAKGGRLVAESALALNAAEALVNSMAVQRDDVSTVVRCTAALATLAKHGPDFAVSILEAGGLGCVEEMAALHGLEGELGHWFHALQEAIDHCTDTDDDLSPASH